VHLVMINLPLMTKFCSKKIPPTLMPTTSNVLKCCCEFLIWDLGGEIANVSNDIKLYIF